jgi:hypothetical protein
MGWSAELIREPPGCYITTKCVDSELLPGSLIVSMGIVRIRIPAAVVIAFKLSRR